MQMLETAMSLDRDRDAPALLVFTDLDGCLLDHETYDYDPAIPAVERLRRLGVPLILTSSKTLSELSVLRRELGLRDPVIAENGGLLGLPSELRWGRSSAMQTDGLTIELLSPPYPWIRAELESLRAERGFSFEGFGDWDVRQVSEATGLPPQEAALAKARQCSEPLVWQDSLEALASFRALLAERSLHLVAGGRFLHVLGPTDKGRALRTVVSRYAEGLGAKPYVLALGDSPNDLEMLRAADRAVVVHNARGPGIPVSDLPEATHTRRSGPRGWREAVDSLLSELGAH